MSRVIEQTIYTFDELTDPAKECVKNFLMDYHFWGKESIDSLKAFAAQFNVKITNWSYSPWGNADIGTDADKDNFRSFKLEDARKLPDFLTGYCLDCTLREVFIKDFESTGNALHAFNEAMDAGIKEARNDWEYQFEDSNVSDHCTANGYEFTESGELASFERSV